LASENDNPKSSSLPRILIPVLVVGGLGAVAVVGAVAAFVITAWIGQPVPILGFEQTYDQPIDFPHTVHASLEKLDHVAADGETMEGLGLDCTFCHRTVTTQASAGVPPVSFCASCHQVIGSADNEQINILRDAADIVGDNGAEPVDWKRVHRLPDHVRFVHEPHIRYLMANPSAIKNSTDGVNTGPSAVCSTCHGNVAAMEQVAQVEPLKMGQCVDCHRDNGAPTDCAACHY
tara:strand:+ start:6011 stop:6709 length:699 start_codon:yes stop_codon:yes gene_type:complete